MNLEEIRIFCLSLPSATEDVKWGQDLTFNIGGKMFCVTGLDGPFGVSFKVKDEEFEELSTSKDIIPAPYVARYKWIHVSDEHRFNKKDWEHYIRQSYDLVRGKLPKKVQAGLD
ncbi:MmcQ/YjbR family DNA-binding protein [Mucilaginibacter myungsuensis]|uniref:MmcQ/YjbR family DNA-binding protein n=1 Tax=Mucilaginibacter myungsuensis TaxID=649104 RepID=A0A929PYE7_9SPHI|nr:MmcQ/YjbR family DNA-binding protein [Mucilaginibacter myungsuensis]MBE9664176.1 MmcQ/YjbR family DNA-binding protein [Mucilaginibacter myungsuensis]MDN3599879.1 MmcQ/YjbR family DNA-binding protein [Mucilaginibacter myungsuensis]